MALHGQGGEDGAVQELLEALGIPYTGPPPAACAISRDKALAKHLLRDAGIPTPDFLVLSETTFKELGAAAALRDIGERLGFPLVVKPAARGSAMGVRFARRADELPGALVAAFSYDDKVVFERHVARPRARDLRARRRARCRSSRRSRTRATSTTSRRATRSGARRFHCPAELGDDAAARGERARRRASASCSG